MGVADCFVFFSFPSLGLFFFFLRPFSLFPLLMPLAVLSAVVPSCFKFAQTTYCGRARSRFTGKPLRHRGMGINRSDACGSRTVHRPPRLSNARMSFSRSIFDLSLGLSICIFFSPKPFDEFDWRAVVLEYFVSDSSDESSP